MNENRFITAYKVHPQEFKDHLQWQNQLYRTPASGDFNSTHIFTIKGDRPTLLIKQAYDGAEEKFDSLLPTSRNRIALRLNEEERVEKLKRMVFDLKVLKEPGIRPIKQVELFQKWRPLLPKEKRDITCPKPSEDVMTKVRNDKRAKAATVKKRKMLDNDGVYNI